MGVAIRSDLISSATAESLAGFPTMILIAILYGSLQDAANEIAYLSKCEYPISGIEMEKEPERP